VVEEKKSLKVREKGRVALDSAGGRVRESGGLLSRRSYGFASPALGKRLEDVAESLASNTSTMDAPPYANIIDYFARAE
jgi:hypothetical protein